MAAVNDITAREEQYQSYLAQNKVETPPKNANQMDYYYENAAVGHSGQSQAHIDSHALHFVGNKSRTTHATVTSTTTTTTPTPKSIFMGECENTRTSCASPADEYVDINEMEFIDEPNGGKDENLLMRRSHRKKTARKCETCKHPIYLFLHLGRKTHEQYLYIPVMVVDRHVPSRAWATLPTSYLFGNCLENSSRKYLFNGSDSVPDVRSIDLYLA